MLFQSLVIAAFAAVSAQTPVAYTTGVAGTASTVTAAASQATVAITIKGNAFFRGSERFYIRGVDYQPGGSSSTVDPLSNQAACDRDIPYFQQLGINTIRVYQIDNSLNHDYCMNLLSKAGIYLVLDVNTAKNSLNRIDASGSYNAVYLQHVFATIDVFKGYTNTMAFFAGNEVINDDLNVPVANWVKAVVRDMKEYITAQSSRYIPTGYSAADVPNSRYLLPEYLNCGSNATRIDFYAFNSYSWCGASSYTQAGYDQFVAGFSNYSVPLFFSEFGCNLVQPRGFTEITAIYGNTDFTSVFSGGLVYEYSQEESAFGLVNVNGNSVTLLADYQNLMKQYAATPNPTGSGGYTTTNPVSTCPGNSTGFSGIWAEDILPAQPAGAAQYIKSGAGTPLGDGMSSQSAGADAVSNVTAGTATSSGRASGSAAASASSTSRSGAGTLEFSMSFGLFALIALYGAMM